MRTILVVILLIFTVRTAAAVDLNECKQQRMQYPANWKDVSKETGLFDCNSRYGGALRVKVGQTDSDGRTLMSLVPLKESGASPASIGSNFAALYFRLKIAPFARRGWPPVWTLSA
jgi:hypothetical protein